MNVNDITITSLETISAFDITTGAYMFTMDELQNAKIAQTQESTDITGKGGRKLSSLDKSKAVTVSGTNGFISGGMLEMQVGDKFTTGTTTVRWMESVKAETVEDAVIAKTTYTAYDATSGAEIKELYKKNADGTLGTKLEQNSTAAAASGKDLEKFTYTPNTKTIAFVDSGSGISAGDELFVVYNRQISGSVLENYSDHFSGKCVLYIDAFGEDKCANQYRVQFYIPKAKFNGNFDLDMGDNQTVHAFEAEALAGGCGAGGMLWTYTVFGAEAEDVA